jgi:hypothetical protein
MASTITRQQLAKFITDPLTLRQFEQFLGDIESAALNAALAGSAAADAQIAAEGATGSVVALQLDVDALQAEVDALPASYVEGLGDLSDIAASPLAFDTVTSAWRVDTIADVIIDDAAKGAVLKSPDGNYWRVSVSDLGVLSATSLGLIKP